METQEIDLDLLDADLIEETIDIDPDANPMEGPLPVADGVHRVKLIAGEGWKHKESTFKDGSVHPFIVANFSAQVIDEGVDFNKRIFPMPITTLVFDGKSEMAYILTAIYGGDDAAKQKVKTLNNYVKLGQAFKAALAGEPIVKATSKWVAKYKDGVKNGKDVYKTALSGMKNFPKNPKGQHIPTVNVKGNEVTARAEIIAYAADV